jgi:bifunctional enzyme CysN/CysC
MSDDAKDILRFVTIGSVDDGKSTLIGRLLYETDSIYLDQYLSVQRTSARMGLESTDLALITDGLKAEREQGITIDVAYRYFSTPKRKFIIADAPGHVQYTRNMVTGASNADLAVILIDAKNGVSEQSKRHGFISSLLQVSHTIVAVNKMDLVSYSEEVFNGIVDTYKEFSFKLDVKDIIFIPISALKGDNVIRPSENMGWYSGQTFLEHLESAYVTKCYNTIDFRFPVQYVIRSDGSFRGYAGKIVSGNIKVGDEVAILPSGEESAIKEIIGPGQSGPFADSGSVVLTLDREIDVGRGDMIVKRDNVPFVVNDFEAIICWFDKEQFQLHKSYILKHTTKVTRAFPSKLYYVIDVNSLHRKTANTMVMNDIGRVRLKTAESLCFDYYKINRSTGSFILIDPVTYNTAAAGVIKFESKSDTNIYWEETEVTRELREKRSGYKGRVVWLTGYSGSGKTTIGKMLEKKLFSTNHHVIVLDGDNIRRGLCGDLGFSPEDRDENLRRVGEVARLLVENGVIVICTFVSPMKKQRDFVRELVGEDFIEVYVKCSIEVCIQRDVKGLYEKFKHGELKDLTGLDAPYEEPDSPDLVLETDKMSVKECVDKVISFLKQ